MAPNKHFWINVAPIGRSNRLPVMGTLICQDNPAAIRQEARTFLAERRKDCDLEWQVSVIRPGGDVCSVGSVREHSQQP